MALTRPGSASDPLWYKDAIIYETARQGVLRQQQRRHRRLSRACSRSSTTSRTSASPASGCCRSSRRRCATTATTSPTTATSTRTTARWRTSRTCCRAAHERGLQVMIELVINHTSDQHPWFQRARQAPAGLARARLLRLERHRPALSPTPASSSPTPKNSNWTWDPVAKAYYWHRFFSHQPDLNFDNPAVRRRGARGHAVLARPGRRRPAPRRHPLSDRARGHQLREPARDARAHPAHPRASMDERLRRPHDPRRGQPVAHRRARLLRRRRRMPHGVPLPPDAAHLHGAAAGGPAADHRHHGADAGHSRELPVGAVPAQPRRADARNGHRRRARLHVPGVQRRPADADQHRHPPPPGAADGQQPRAASSCSTACCSRFPARRSSTTATRSAWATTSTSATATACARRCSGAPTATPGSRAPTPARLYSPVDHGSGLRLPGDQRRGAAERPVVAAALDAQHDRAAQAVQRLRPRHARVPASVESQGAGLPAPTTRTSRSSAWPTCRASPSRSSSTWPPSRA